MKILCWNVRGFENPLTFRALRDLIRRVNLSLVFLSETRLELNGCDRIRVSLGFEGCFFVDRIDFGSGLALFWRDGVDVRVNSFSKGHIDSIVSCDGLTWRFTGFYGDPK
ncbi:hypothetical protein ACOSP7_024748 [Xanthoceras sorbifolium]